MTRARSILQDTFGFSEFRPVQDVVVEQVVAGGDAFVLMPTGGGKSLCYQLPALARPGVGVVVSPLISLMKDQVDALQAAGVRAAAYNSSLPPHEARSVLAQLMAGELDLLYVAPETIMTEAFLSRLRTVADQGSGLSLIAIDEAHCVSQWGHDFRPEYVRLGELKRLFGDIPLVACTATADPQTRDDVRARLGLMKAPCFVSGFDRPNIRYMIVEKREPLAQLKRFLRERSSDAGIVYCLSRKRAEDVASRLSSSGFAAAAYHAGLPAEERLRVQDAFARDDLPIVVATVAFGMGIDKSNVRWVVHYDLPKSIESYYQETGRAGRDGMPADALLLFGPGDAPAVRALIDRSGIDGRARAREQVRIELHKLDSMVSYAAGLSCRRQALLRYFGEEAERECGNCDICLEPPETYDATQEARMALSAVYRAGQGFGQSHIVDVLTGTPTQKVLGRGHERLSTFGIGAHLPREHWATLLRQLIHRGYLAQDLARYSVLTLTPRAWPLLRGDEELVLARPRVAVRSHTHRAVVGASTSRASLTAEDEELFDGLRGLRRRIAAEAGVPAYVVFTDATLCQMAARRPRTHQDMLSVPGVGATKLQRYGDAFLDHIRGGAGSATPPT